MRRNKKGSKVLIILLFISPLVFGQECSVDDNIDIYNLENEPNNFITISGSTVGAANTFEIPNPPDTLGWINYSKPDVIYEMVIDPGDTFNLFFDLCPSTNYDASIAIVKK